MVSSAKKREPEATYRANFRLSSGEFGSDGEALPWAYASASARALDSTPTLPGDDERFKPFVHARAATTATARVGRDKSAFDSWRVAA